MFLVVDRNLCVLSGLPSFSDVPVVLGVNWNCVEQVETQVLVDFGADLGCPPQRA